LIISHSLFTDPVGEASNGLEAVELARRFTPDVVLMDLLMPEMDGVAATEAIRQELPDTQVVALTSVLEDQAIIDAIRVGAISYLRAQDRPDHSRRRRRGGRWLDRHVDVLQ
jgi:DNA-binding NarL/FixJ family response regulator